MPEELDRIDGSGTAMLVPLLIFADFMYVIAFATHSWGLGWVERHGLALMWDAILAAGLGLGLWWRARPAIRAFGWREALRAAFHPPKFWSWWWPRAFRRPDDQWDRLPALVRRVRSFKGATALLLVADFVLAWPLVVAGVVDPGHPGFMAHAVIVYAAMFAGVWGIIASSRAASDMLGALGLGKHDATKFIELANIASDPAWRNPHFARILLPASAATGVSRAPQTPTELADAIIELNGRLLDAGFLPDDECVQAAQSARAAIEALESEVQQLHRDLDPEEGPRLERRLAALGGAGDPELRHLLEGQQAVLRRLEQQRQEKESRRDRLRDQLVTLWMQLVELNARAARGAQDPELTGRVRVLSSALARGGEALVEVEQSLLFPQRSRVTT
jgi:hypothetical protein